MQIMRQLMWCSAMHNFSMYEQHIPSVTNGKADALYHFQIQQLKTLASQAQP